MPAPKRVVKMAFVLVPEYGKDAGRDTVRAAQSACRIAHQLGYIPVSPLLYFLTFMSVGELSMEIKKLSQQWLKRCDRIWLQYSSPTAQNAEVIDGLAFDILASNQRSSERRPVYLLHPTGDDKIGFVPVAMAQPEIRELLNLNLTAGLARRCI
jgi:hypothetical protein